MQAELPCIAECAQHFGLAREIVVAAVTNIALVHERLEVRAVTHAIRGVEIDHLNLAGKGLFLEQRVHHQQRVPGDEPVRPPVRVLVEVQCLAQRWILRGLLEEGGLDRARLLPPYGLEDRARIDALMHVERDRRYLERHPLGLPRPLQFWIEVRVVGVLLPRLVAIALRRDEADRRVIGSFLPAVLVLLDRLLFWRDGGGVTTWHLEPLPRE